MTPSRRIWLWSLRLAGVVLIAALALFFWVLHDLPDVHSLTAQLNLPSARITDRNGKLLYDVLPANGGRHMVVALDALPLRLRQATLATEDSHFYENAGVDVSGILRAVWINLRGGETISGGSTITQQVARNLLLSPEERTQRSLRRKLRESLLAWQLTQNYSKDEILAFYLNQTYYGSLAYGAEAASQTFFGKPAAELDLAEAALLAGLPQSPSKYDPLTHWEAAKQRQAIVLGLMEKQGWISADQRALAEAETLNFNSNPYPIEAPHFVMLIRSQLDTLVSPEDIYRHGGVQVRTTLNLDWQHHAEDAIQQQLTHLKEKGAQSLGYNVHNAALVALDPHNGEVLAMVGSPNYFDAQYSGAVNMAIAPRQPGSALKPLIYAAAFDPQQPQPWTPATMLLDVTTHFVTHDGLAYTPANYDNLEHGPVLAREALASSLNIPAVLTLDHIHLSTLFTLTNRLGITTLQNPGNYDLSLALGGGEVSLLQLTAAYAALDHQGVRVQPASILEVRGTDGTLLYQHSSVAQPQVIDPRVAWLITDILSDDAARSIGFGRNSVLHLDRPAAVKTGTTSNFHDNWCVGYTPDLVVGVWAGNANHEAMRQITGLTGAAPIWHEFIRTVLADRPALEFKRPAGLIQEQVCTLSGLLPTPDCPYRRSEWFIAGTQPTQPDTFYHRVEIDSATGQLANAATPAGRRVSQVALDLPPQAYHWAHSKHLLLLADLDQNAPIPDSSGQDVNAQLQIVAPADQTIFHLSNSAEAASQQMQVRLAVQPGLTQVQVWMDGQVIAALPAEPYQIWWKLTAGPHTLEANAKAPDGSPVQARPIHFTVK